MSTDATNDVALSQCDDCAENPGAFPTRIEDEPVNLCEDCALNVLTGFGGEE